MSDETALLKAIIANAADDTPRLVYADWLDEHDAPIQAEYIRTQCRLANCPAADPDHPDVLERSAELAAQFALALRLTAPELPPGFAFERDLTTGAGPFRRGFVDAACGEWSDSPSVSHIQPTDEQIDRLCTGLAALVATTTVRHLCLYGMSPEALTRVLAAPGAEALAGLTLSAAGFEANADRIVAALVRVKAVTNLERLALFGPIGGSTLGVLAGTRLPRLRELALPFLGGRPEELAPLLRTAWVRNLRCVTLGAPPPLERPLLAALAELPHLEALDINCTSRSALQAFGTAGGFPALARLAVRSYGATDRLGAHLARGQFPRLADLTAPHFRDDTLPALLGAKWLPQLRVFDVSNGYLTDRSAIALSKSPAAPGLRVLRVSRNRFTKTGLAALGRRGRFPNLTTLDLRAGYTQVHPETLARFAAELSLSRIRHLHLDGWPLGDAGAKALGANPRLAGVTRLSLARCQLTDRGFAALARSPHLQQLIELDLTHNSLKRAAALLDTDQLPRLAKLNLAHNPIVPAARTALHRARGWLV